MLSLRYWDIESLISWVRRKTLVTLFFHQNYIFLLFIVNFRYFKYSKTSTDLGTVFKELTLIDTTFNNNSFDESWFKMKQFTWLFLKSMTNLWNLSKKIMFWSDGVYIVSFVIYFLGNIWFHFVGICFKFIDMISTFCHHHSFHFPLLPLITMSWSHWIKKNC